MPPYHHSSGAIADIRSLTWRSTLIPVRHRVCDSNSGRFRRRGFRGKDEKEREGEGRERGVGG